MKQKKVTETLFVLQLLMFDMHALSLKKLNPDAQVFIMGEYYLECFSGDCNLFSGKQHVLSFITI